MYKFSLILKTSLKESFDFDCRTIFNFYLWLSYFASDLQEIVFLCMPNLVKNFQARYIALQVLAMVDHRCQTICNRMNCVSGKLVEGIRVINRGSFILQRTKHSESFKFSHSESVVASCCHIFQPSEWNQEYWTF